MGKLSSLVKFTENPLIYRVFMKVNLANRLPIINAPRERLRAFTCSLSSPTPFCCEKENGEKENGKENGDNHKPVRHAIDR